jgi:drug/metabolite transporter (DMT)-like permease
MIMWGNTIVAIKYAGGYVSPLQLVGLRFPLAGLAFALILLPFRASRIWILIRVHWGRLALMGLFGGVLNNAFWAWSTRGIPGGTATLIAALIPAFTYLLSAAFLGERFAWNRSIGIIIAFIGLVVLIGWGTGRQLGLGEFRYGVLAVLAVATHAAYTVLGKPLLEYEPPLLVTGVSMSFAGLFSLAFLSPGFVAMLPTLPITFWGSMLFLSLLSTVFAFAVWCEALQRMPAGQVGSFTYLVPLVGVLSGHWFLDEPITIALGIGGALVIAGVILVTRG